MKGFTGAQLLSVAAALAGLAQAKQINKARMVENADMAAIPNLDLLEHGIELTHRGPNGGWRVWGSHRGGGGSGSNDVNVNVGLTATVTADVDVSGTVAATVEQVCAAGRTLCSPGFCSDLEEDAKNCGQCGAECPKHATCVEPFDNLDYPCECPEELNCLRRGECREPVCGESCDPCPEGQVCDGSACVCPYSGEPDYCPPTANLAGGCNNLFWDDYNCGACQYRCPAYTDCIAGNFPVDERYTTPCACTQPSGASLPVMQVCYNGAAGTGEGYCVSMDDDDHCGNCDTYCDTDEVCAEIDGWYECTPLKRKL